MTQTVVDTCRRILKSRLAEVEAEAAEIRSTLSQLDGHPPQGAPGPSFVPPADPPTPPPHPLQQDRQPTQAMSPLVIRCDELRDLHGPVYAIGPLTPPPEVGQSVRWSPRPGDEKTFEVLEAANLANQEGTIIPGRFFAKLVDA